MLSISKITNPKGFNYYLDLAREDYYLNGGEPPGRWYGKGLAHFGIKHYDTVDRKTLSTIFAGFHPSTAEKLVQNADSPSRTYAWDMTFSMPKSLSTLWSQTTPEKRKIIQEIHDEAVKLALDYAQEVAGYTRRGKGGKQLDHADLVFALFDHGTSRAGEPNYHTHAVQQNVGVRSDGSTGALDTQELYEHKMATGAIYRLGLACGCKQRLGVHVERTKDTFEIVGVSKTLCNLFSSRSREIRAEMSRLGVSGSKAAEIVNLATRHTKESQVPREQQFEGWEYTGRLVDWSTNEAEKVYNRDPFQDGMEVPLERMAEQVFEKLIDNKTITCERDFLTKLATQAVVHGSTLEEVKKAVATELASNRVVAAGMVGTKMYYTRTDLQSAETSLAKLLDQAKHTRHHVLSKTVYRKVIKNNPHLSSEQKQALRIITRRKGSIASVLGIAGAGKTTTLEAIKEAYESAGYTVQCLGPTNQIARALEENLKVSSSTVHSYLNREKKEILDESGKTIRWKVDRDVLDRIREKLPSTTVLDMGFLKIEAQQTRPLLNLKKGIFRAVPGVDWVTKAPWGHIKVTLPKRKRPNHKLKKPDKPHKTLFSMFGIRLEVWKHPPCWNGVGPNTRFHIPYLKLNPGPKHPQLLDKKTVTIVDEAGMIDTKVMNDLMLSIAATGGKLILVGDGSLPQLQPVQAGAYIREVIQRAPAMELREIRRQTNEEDRKVVRHIAEGEAEKALENLIKRGRYHESPTPEDTVKQIVSDWSEACRDNPKAGLIIAATNEWNNKLNNAAQEHRILAGQLGPETLPVGDINFRVGDRVLFTGKSREIGVLKGDMGIVTEIKGSKMKVLLDTDKKVTVPTAVFQDVRLGYSITTHRSQGSTVDKIFIMAGPNWVNRELAYVQVSRARSEIHLYCDQATAGPERKKLIKMMNRSEAKGTIGDALESAITRSEERQAAREEKWQASNQPARVKAKTQRTETTENQPVVVNDDILPREKEEQKTKQEQQPTPVDHATAANQDVVNKEKKERKPRPKKQRSRDKGKDKQQPQTESKHVVVTVALQDPKKDQPTKVQHEQPEQTEQIRRQIRL